MNIVRRTVITLTDGEQQILKAAADILLKCADNLDEYNGGSDGGYNIRGMASDLENFVEDNSEIICEEEEV